MKDMLHLHPDLQNTLLQVITQMIGKPTLFFFKCIVVAKFNLISNHSSRDSLSPPRQIPINLGDFHQWQTSPVVSSSMPMKTSQSVVLWPMTDQSVGSFMPNKTKSAGSSIEMPVFYAQ